MGEGVGEVGRKGENRNTPRRKREREERRLQKGMNRGIIYQEGKELRKGEKEAEIEILAHCVWFIQSPKVNHSEVEEMMSKPSSGGGVTESNPHCVISHFPWD